jgi:hypothetical protein
MPEFTVHLQSVTGYGIKVEAETPEDAIELAYETGPGSICAQCSGWGSKWWREEGDELELVEVINEDGDEVYTEKTYVEQLQEQVRELQAQVRRLKNVF